MALEPGTRIGPYELGSLVGEGGMGVVYRAHDDRLQRDVAIKVMSEASSGDAVRTRLMQQEARAASKLSHPNILAVFDVGTHQGLMYLVTELLEGETLRDLVKRGPTPWRKALGLAVQIAEGLVAAHGQGIIHRDIKPDNVFVTADGHVKILDFGVATLRPAEGSGLALAQTASQNGLVVGTVGYMSPEQTRGEKVDDRSDLFAFGCVLYELVAGSPAFPGGSPIEILTAIQRDAPVPLDELAPSVRATLVEIVDRCLEKDPAKRFQTARDLRFALALVETGRQPAPGAALVIGTAPTMVEASPPARRGLSRRAVLGIGALLVVDSALSIATWRALATSKPAAPNLATPPSFKQITFQRGTVYTARFTLDGTAIVYSAEWDGRPRDLFVTVPGTHDSRSLAQPASDVAYILATGELSVIHREHGGFSAGVLARLSLAGGPPRQLVDGINWADGSTDGTRLMVVRRGKDRKATIEMPPGKVLLESAHVAYPRLSPDGAHIAFLDYSGLGEDAGKLVVIDPSGKRVVESEDFDSIEGVGWRSSNEIWFTAAKQGRSLWLFAMDLAGGDKRLLCRVAGRLVLHDVAPDGRVVAERNSYRASVVVGGAPDGRETNLGWQDYPQLAQLSRDGKQLLFSEIGDGGGVGGVAYLRPVSGGAPLRLGDGFALALSGDGSQALVRISGGPGSETHLELVPIGSGHPVALPAGGLAIISWAAFVPGSSRIVILAREAGKADRLYVQDTTGGAPRMLTPEGFSVSGDAVSPDGSQLAATQDAKPVLIALDSGAIRALPGLTAEHAPLAWTSDGKTLFVRGSSSLPIVIQRYELASGTLAPWRTLANADPAGVLELGRVSIARDGEIYAYESYQLLSDLFVIEGLH